VYSPQYALWLLPLAVMARPRLRDQLIWQAGELYYFASVWWYLGTYLNPGGGGDAGFYWLAVAIRVAAQLYLVVLVVRDVLMPEHDVVRDARPAPARHSFWPPTEPGRLTLGRAGGG
jgi:heme exporter protein D